MTECRSISTDEDDQIFDAREEPDGEETVPPNAGTAASSIRSTAVRSHPNRSVRLSGIPPEAIGGLVKVPNWVMAEASLDVLFNDRATQQVAELQVNRVSCK